MPEVYKIKSNETTVNASFEQRQLELDKWVAALSKQELAIKLQLKEIADHKKTAAKQQQELWEEQYSDNTSWFEVWDRLQEEGRE